MAQAARKVSTSFVGNKELADGFLALENKISDAVLSSTIATLLMDQLEKHVTEQDILDVVHFAVSDVAKRCEALQQEFYRSFNAGCVAERAGVH